MGRVRVESAEGGPLANVKFEDVAKVYADGTRAVSGLNLDIGDGEFMVFVGPSGCGKTTALRMVAGLESISEGVLRIGDRAVNHVASRDRDIAMVFQSYALYPHLSVYENIAFGLRVRKMPKSEIDKRVRNAAGILGLDPFLQRKPRALSGGQRQRVAMGRAIVREPAAFLMDEPLSNLDAKLRVQMRAEIGSLQHELGVTTIYVTHDQVEAMTMGDRVAVMRKGEVQQVAAPQVLYDRPVNLFVAGFIGSPAMNVFEGTVRGANGGLAVEAGSQRLILDAEALAARPGLRGYVDRPVIVGIRPEDIHDAALMTDTPPERRLHGKVMLTEALGSEIVVHLLVDTPPASTEEVRELASDAGGDLRLAAVDAEAPGTTFVGKFNPRSQVKVGESVEAAVDTRSMHFFDPASGLGIHDTNAKEGTPT
jgi:multiple sugar transport system ATP-binding protein